MDPQKNKPIPIPQKVSWSGEMVPGRAIDVYVQIAQEEKTGVLKLARGKIAKELYFRRGWLLFGRSNVVNECLGRILSDGGKISKEDLDKCLELMKTTKKRQGELLIEMGVLSPDEIYFALKYQLKQRATEVMKWEDGQYQFVEGVELDPSITDITRIPVPSMIYEGIKEIYNPEKIRADLEPFLDEYLARVENPAFKPKDLGFQTNEADLYTLISGFRSLREILTLSKLNLRSTYMVLFTLFRLGLIEYRVLEDAVLEKRDREKILDLYKDLKGQDFFAILGIKDDARPDEIEEAYHRARQALRPPDGLSRITPEVEKVRADIQGNYDQAYEILSNDAKRAQYLVKYRQDKEKEEKAEADKAVLGADLEFGRGETFLFWKQDYKQAVESLTNAVKMNPKEPEYLATLALAVYLNDRGKIGQARELINKALSIGPKCDKAYLYMGRILKEEKNTSEAAKFFQKAIDLNPENRKVLKQMLKGEDTGKTS